jgi:hypothetical protein
MRLLVESFSSRSIRTRAGGFVSLRIAHSNVVDSYVELIVQPSTHRKQLGCNEGDIAFNDVVMTANLSSTNADQDSWP